MTQLDEFFAIPKSDRKAIETNILSVLHCKDSKERNIANRAIDENRRDIIDILLYPARYKIDASNTAELTSIIEKWSRESGVPSLSATMQAKESDSTHMSLSTPTKATTSAKKLLEGGVFFPGTPPKPYSSPTPHKLAVTNSSGMSNLPKSPLTPKQPATQTHKRDPKLDALSKALTTHRDGNAETFQVIKDLLEDHSVNFNIKLSDFGDNRPLHIAVMNNLEDVVTLLLNSDKVKINAANKNGDTALHIAAILGYNKMVELLLVKGAGSSMQNSDGKTAAQMATEESTKTLIKDFIKKQSEQEYISKEIVRILDEDDESGLQDLTTKFPKLDITIPNTKGLTICHKAASKGAVQVMKLLIQSNKALLEGRDELGQTPLHKAVLANQLRIVEELLKAGVKFVADKAGHTPLYYAHHSETLPEITKLLSMTKEGIEYNKSSIIKAIQEKDIEALKLLLEHGADFDMPLFPDGNTALHLATELKLTEVVSFLCFTAKVNPHTKNKYGNGETASYIASKNHNSVEILEIIASAKKSYDLSPQSLTSDTQHGKRSSDGDASANKLPHTENVGAAAADTWHWQMLDDLFEKHNKDERTTMGPDDMAPNDL